MPEIIAVNIKLSPALFAGEERLIKMVGPVYGPWQTAAGPYHQPQKKAPFHVISSEARNLYQSLSRLDHSRISIGLAVNIKRNSGDMRAERKPLFAETSC
jgi:hypothetical protein